MTKENMSDIQIIKRLKVNESAYFPAYRHNTIRQRVYDLHLRFEKKRLYVTKIMVDEGTFKVTRVK